MIILVPLVYRKGLYVIARQERRRADTFASSNPRRKLQLGEDGTVVRRNPFLDHHHLLDLEPMGGPIQDVVNLLDRLVGGERQQRLVERRALPMLIDDGQNRTIGIGVQIARQDHRRRAVGKNLVDGLGLLLTERSTL